MPGGILENVQSFATKQPDEAPPLESPKLCYAADLFVDNGGNRHPLIMLKPNPTYDNLFGRFEYRHAGMRLETDFSLPRAGAVHRANGSILAMRAEAPAAGSIG